MRLNLKQHWDRLGNFFRSIQKFDKHMFDLNAYELIEDWKEFNYIRFRITKNYP